MSFKTSSTVCRWSFQKGLLTSTRCMTTSAEWMSSRQLLKEANRACGRSEMKPTVSYKRAVEPEGSLRERMVLSRVWKSMSLVATVCLPKRRFMS